MLEAVAGWIYRREPRIAPVRDALSPTLEQHLRQDPWQSLHFALPQEENLEARWRLWQQAQVIIPEPLPAFYVYSQAFYAPTFRQQWGLIGLLPASASILPHEGTLPERVQEMAESFRRFPLQTTPIQLFIDLPVAPVERLIREYLSCPLFSVSGEEGVMHRWTPIHHYRHQAELRQWLGTGPFLLADGHHRWAALRRAGLAYILAYVIPLENAPPLLAPIHRLLRGVDEVFLEAIEPYFSVQRSRSRLPLWQEVQGIRYSLGLVSPRGEFFLAKLRPALWAEAEAEPLPACFYRWVLSRLSEAVVEYSREPASIVESAMRGAGWGVIFPPFSFSYVRRAAVQQRLLPPKTTYFYPKVVSGLCFYYEGDFGLRFAAPARAS